MTAMEVSVQVAPKLGQQFVQDLHMLGPCHTNAGMRVTRIPGQGWCHDRGRVRHRR